MATRSSSEAPGDSPQPRRRSRASRRAGYAVAALANGAILYVLRGRPGWEDLSFLTDETSQVLGIVTASLVVSLAANLVYLVADPPWVRSLGDVVTTAVGLVAIVRVWQVFPFDFAGYAVDWAVLLRILLVVGFVGSVVALPVHLVRLGRHLAGTSVDPPGR